MATGSGPPKPMKVKSSKHEESKPAIRMYHVTNVIATAQEPDWSEVRLCVPYDKHYDGPLCGLPVACFSTTLYKGKLPTFSPYPRGAARDTKHWRVSVPFDPDDYEIFLMHKAPGQVQLLCLAKDKPSDLEKELKTLLSLHDKKLTLNMSFPNEYKKEKYIVNVHFVQPVPLTEGYLKWARVKKTGNPYKPKSDPIQYSADLSKKWIEKYSKENEDVKELTKELKKVTSTVHV